MNKKAPFYIVLIVEILAVVLAGIGILEREAVLIMTGLLIFYFIFSKLEDSLILFIISIPLFIALSVTESFDTMANWRILLAVLFLKWFFVNNIWKREKFLKRFNLKKYSRLTILVALFLVIGFLSLTQAVDVIVGAKKLLFLINIFLLFVIVRDLARDEKTRLRIIKSGALAGIISLIVGYSQVISIFLTPLYNFWQWWARNVISVFYGFDLSSLLNVSNTWFSYYADSPPTLRMFSVFPDSHSFALFTIISLIFFTFLYIWYKNQKVKFFTALCSLFIVLSFLALVFCGSRGAWLSAAIPFLIVVILFIYSLLKNKKYSHIIRPNSHLIRMGISLLLVFIVAFPVSSLIMSQSQAGANGTLAFKRAKTLADLEELSVKSRMEIWGKSFKSILRRPLLGVGIGNYPVVLDEDISAGKRGASAHNLYLDITSEIGLLGLIVLLLIFWQILKKSLKNTNQFSFVFIFFFLWILIYNLFDVVLLNDKVLLLFMVALGALYSHEEISINKSSNL